MKQASQTECDVCFSSLTEQKLTHNRLGSHTDHGGICNSCPRCGTFYITFKALDLINEHSLKRHIFSYYIRKEYDDRGHNNEYTEINSTFIQQRANLPEIPLEKKADLLLQALAKDTKNYGDSIEVFDKKHYIAIACLQDRQSLCFCLDMLKEGGFITLVKGSLIPDTPTVDNASVSVSITPKGFMRLDALNKQTDSSQIFIAMWFDSSMDEALNEAIKPAISDAKLNPFRIDDKDHNNKIDDEIIAEIQRSRAVVADFSGHRGGVYFEAGYALGLGLPVIWTCRKDHEKELHFDIRQYNNILWENTEEGLSEFRKKLYQRIRSTILSEA